MFFEGTIRVLVVDDHVGIRNGITRLINAEWPRMRGIAAGTPLEALTLARDQQPDVVVLDVNLDGEDGLALIPQLLALSPCRVVVLSSLSDPRLATHARRSGAHACLHKAAPASELLDCVLIAHLSRKAQAPSNAGVHVSHAVGDEKPGSAGHDR